MLRNDAVEAFGGSPVQTLEQVPVRVQDGSHRGVAEATGDGFRVLSLGDQQGHMAVAEVVKAAGLAH